MVLCLLWMRRKHCSSLHLSVLVNILKEWVIRSTELIFTQQQPDSPLAQLASTLILKNARAFTTKNTKKLQNIKMKHTTLTKSKILLHKYMLINLRSFWIKTGLFVLSFITFSGLENAMYKFHDFFQAVYENTAIDMQIVMVYDLLWWQDITFQNLQNKGISTWLL